MTTEKKNKSLLTQKVTNKEVYQSPEELKLKKLEDIVHKLQQAVEKGSNIEQSHQEQSKRNATNKSNFSSPTSTRMKEDRSDREFLSNFMNIDEKNVIPPKKMHLLTDNDINQNITAREKYQNLSDLLMDDKNITEFNFIRNTEDRIKLHLYSAFSKKAKEIFMNEKHPKQSKNQMLFHKINDIHIPKFGFNPPMESNTNTEGDIVENNNSIIADFLNKKNKIKEAKKEEGRKFSQNYFRKENKGYFHIPSLVKIKKEERDNIRANNKKDEKIDEIFWDPEIDSDTLSYINHNFICIEDIYNSNNKNKEEKYEKNKTEKNKTEDAEPNLTPIMAKEIIFRKDSNNFLEDKNAKGFGHKDKKNDEKPNNKFIEYIAINVGVTKQEIQVMPNIKSKQKFESQLKNHFEETLNKYMAIDKNDYPAGEDLTPKRIERFLRFKFLREISKQIDFSIEAKSTKQSDKKDNENDKKDNENDKKDNENEDKNLIYSENDYDIYLSHSFKEDKDSKEKEEKEDKDDKDDKQNKQSELNFKEENSNNDL